MGGGVVTLENVVKSVDDGGDIGLRSVLVGIPRWNLGGLAFGSGTVPSLNNLDCFDCGVCDALSTDDFLNHEDGENKAAGVTAWLFLTLELRGVFSSKLSFFLRLSFFGGVVVDPLVLLY